MAMEQTMTAERMMAKIAEMKAHAAANLLPPKLTPNTIFNFYHHVIPITVFKTYISEACYLLLFLDVTTDV
jgi:hypothetical protein